MDPVRNPFSPGAGTQPPELAGRESILENMRVQIGRAARGRSARGQMLVGLRGVGKTVLLDRIRLEAEDESHAVVQIEASESRSLPSLLAPAIRSAVLSLSLRARTQDRVVRALRGLAGFVKLKAKYHDLEVAIEADSEPGLADSGDLQHDLVALFEAVSAVAAEQEISLIIMIDELQYVPEPQLETLILALHRAAQRRWPILLIGAGLPQLRARLGIAKSYAERMFDFPEIGPLDFAAAEAALRRPAQQEDADFTPHAVHAIFDSSEGYPYFLQEFGKQTWDAAENPLLDLTDVERGRARALAELDRSFFLVRFDRCTPLEKQYLRAMAELGPGPHRSGEIADVMDRKINQLAPVRQSLITKGMIYAPGHGDTAFTVPLFDTFMRRIMPTFASAK